MTGLYDIQFFKKYLKMQQPTPQLKTISKFTFLFPLESADIAQLNASLPHTCSPPIPGFDTFDLLFAFIQVPSKSLSLNTTSFLWETAFLSLRGGFPSWFLPVFWKAEDSTQMSRRSLFSTTVWEDGLQARKLEFQSPRRPVQAPPSEGTSGWHL